ncbi:MAG: hypothetical protein K8H90_03280, partial [Thermoanaerobaculia bacterium]|nr:hypothetical protein [Thermoanaerobaculia bacterium]
MNAGLFDDPREPPRNLRELPLRVPALVGEPAVAAEAEPIRDAFLASLRQLLSEIPDTAHDPESPFHSLTLEVCALHELLASTRSAAWWTLVPRRHGADVRRYLRCRGKCSRALDLLEASRPS